MANVTVYVMTVWQNLPTKTSALEATNLNHLEQGIKNVTDFVNTINASSGLYLCQTPFTTALKNKLDGIEAGANNYTLPTASASTKGGVKVDGVTITIDANGVISAAAAAIPNLSNLSDVNISSLADGQILKWDATNSKWVNANESGGTTINELNDVGDVNITNPAAGQGLVYDAQNQEWINANVASAMASLTDVDLTGLADGNVLVWDAINHEWVPGEPGDVLGYDETLQILRLPAEPVYMYSLLTPKMTADNAPSGTVIYSSCYNNSANYYGWRSFDQVLQPSSEWASASGDFVGAYIGYHFPSPVVVGRLIIYNRDLTGLTNKKCHAPKQFKFQASNDGTNWVDLATCNVTEDTSKFKSQFEIINNTLYSYYRMYYTEAFEGDSDNASIGEVEMYEKILV